MKKKQPEHPDFKCDCGEVVKYEGDSYSYVWRKLAHTIVCGKPCAADGAIMFTVCWMIVKQHRGIPYEKSMETHPHHVHNKSK